MRRSGGCVVSWSKRPTVMKQWQILPDDSCEPDERHLLDRVFAAAWQHIEGRHRDGDAGPARESLASIIVALSKLAKGIDAEAFTAAAVKAFDQWDSFPH